MKWDCLRSTPIMMCFANSYQVQLSTCSQIVKDTSKFGKHIQALSCEEMIAFASH